MIGVSIEILCYKSMLPQLEKNNEPLEEKEGWEARL